MAEYTGGRGLASRMSAYGDESSPWERGKEAGRQMSDKIGETAEAIATGNPEGFVAKQIAKRYTPGTDGEKGYFGKHRGLDVMHDDKGMMQGGEFQTGKMGEAYGNVRKYFGDRLSAMKDMMKKHPTAKNSVMETVDPNMVNANKEATEDNTITLDEQTGVEGMEGPTMDVPNEGTSGLSFDPKQFKNYNEITAEQLDEWKNYYGTPEAGLQQFGNWWNKQQEPTAQESFSGKSGRNI